VLNKKNTVPLVSMGMPVFNGGDSICKALDSLLSQTFTDFELLISDNASTDNTREICERYAQKDERIVYVRQLENKGIGPNFSYVLKHARGEYFMWTAVDDIWDHGFLMENLRSFKLDDTIIASMSKVELLDNTTPMIETYPLMGSVSDNIIKFMNTPCYCLYALYKRHVLSNCFDEDHFFGHDWEIVIKTLTYGKYYEVEKVLFYRSCGGLSTKGIIVNLRLNETRLIDRIFPLFKCTTKILTNTVIPRSVKIRCIPMLLRYNFKFTLSLLKERVIAHCNNF
jgi:glycosyltransferase involved in cell wall biosynthesis